MIALKKSLIVSGFLKVKQMAALLMPISGVRSLAVKRVLKDRWLSASLMGGGSSARSWVA